MWNKSYFNESTWATTKSANTIDAAPLNPAHDIKYIWLKLALKGSIINDTAKGLAIIDKNKVIKIEGIRISGILWGNDKNPIKKKIVTWQSAVIPSKK